MMTQEGSEKFLGTNWLRKIYNPISAGYYNFHTVIWKDRNKNMKTKDVSNI